MDTINIQEKKLRLITWISQLKDVSLIEKLEELYNEDIEIYQWQKDIVLERIDTAKQEDYIPWNDAKNLLI